jgi:hypothetical protein
MILSGKQKSGDTTEEILYRVAALFGLSTKVRLRLDIRLWHG